MLPLNFVEWSLIVHIIDRKFSWKVHKWIKRCPRYTLTIEVVSEIRPYWKWFWDKLSKYYPNQPSISLKFSQNVVLHLMLPCKSLTVKLFVILALNGYI